MEPLDLSSLTSGALVLVDSAPIIYCLEEHPRFASRFRPLFDRQAAAARFGSSLKLKLPDAIQVASAIAVNADALATHDRDFRRVKTLRILC